ncbi:MAG: DUF3794 domain-containing protein [Clostridia bacterium]
MNLEKNSCKFSEVVCELTNEKVVECDFIVPDYYPDILKVMHTEAIPRIKSKSKKDDKYLVEGYVDFKIFYTSQELDKLICVSTMCDFLSSFDLKQMRDDSLIKVKIDTSEALSKAISERKLSSKVTLDVALKCWNENSTEIVTATNNDKLEQKLETISVYNIISSKTKAVAISEDIETSATTAQIQSILKSDAKIIVNDIKPLSNKVVVHGIATVKNVYVGIDDEIEEIESKIPFSQIIEMDEIDEDAKIDVSFDVSEIQCSLKQTQEGENRLIAVDLEIMTNVTCFNNIETIVLEDAFSLNSNADIDTKKIKYDKLIDISKDSYMDKVAIEIEYDIKKIIYANNSVKIINFTRENENVIANCELYVCILFLNIEDEIIPFKKTIPFKVQISCDNTEDNLKFEATADLVNWSYNITSDNSVDIRFEAEVKCIIIARKSQNAIVNITIDEDLEKAASTVAPVTIYYAKKGEKIWDISKKYNTVGEEIKTINEIELDFLESDMMLIIPKIKYVK